MSSMKQEIGQAADTVKQYAKGDVLPPFTDPGELRNQRIVGKRYKCALCGSPFTARAPTQRFCCTGCHSTNRRFNAAHGPALVPLLIVYSRYRKRKKGSREHRMAMDAFRDLCSRGRELRDMIDQHRD